MRSVAVGLLVLLVLLQSANAGHSRKKVNRVGATNQRSSDETHGMLDIILDWENTNSKDGLPDETQETAIEAITEFLNNDMGASATVLSVSPSLGLTPTGKMGTVGVIRINHEAAIAALSQDEPVESASSGVTKSRRSATTRMAAPAPPVELKRNTRSLLATAASENDKEESKDKLMIRQKKLVIDYAIELLKKKESDTYLKFVIHDIIASNTSSPSDAGESKEYLARFKRSENSQTGRGGGKRNLLGYQGRDEPVKLAQIIIGESVLVSTAIENDFPEEVYSVMQDYDEDQGENEEVRIKQEARRGVYITTDHSASKASKDDEQLDDEEGSSSTRSILSFAGSTPNPVDKRFKPRFVATGPGAKSKIESTPSYRYNLDRINQRNLPLDGNIEMPAYFNSPVMPTYNLVFDTVVRLTHSEFGGRASEYWNSYPDEVGVCATHGTHVAGTIGGNTVGVNKASYIVSFRVLNCEGYGYTSDIIEGLFSALQFCTEKGGKTGGVYIINMSFGGPGNPANAGPLAYVFNQLRTQCGAALVAAAGNSAIDACGTIPGGLVNENQGKVFTVGATNNFDNFASFSNYGGCLGASGPGVTVVSAGAGDDTEFISMSGTSMVSPLLAGIISRLMSMQPLNWYLLHPNSLYADSVMNKVKSDAAPVVRNLPNLQTTPLLMQINNIPMPGTELFAPVPPTAVPPAQLHSSATQMALDMYCVVCVFIGLWLLAE